MALTITGRLAALDCTAGALRDIYTVPVSRVADVNITVVNRTNFSTSIRIAHIKNGVAAGVTSKDYLLYDFPTSALIINYAPIEKSGVLMQAGDTIAVSSNSRDVSVQINGIEEDA